MGPSGDDDGRVRRLLLACLLTCAVALGPAAPALAGDSSTTATTEAPPAADIIPKPNSGAEPQDAGDRGGALQTVVFLLVVGGTVLIAALIVRESRKARAQRGF